jgi:hypothetical protein
MDGNMKEEHTGVIKDVYSGQSLILISVKIKEEFIQHI